MDETLTAQQVAARLGVARTTIYGLMRKHGLPKPLRIGGARRWPTVEIEAWRAAREAERHG